MDPSDDSMEHVPWSLCECFIFTKVGSWEKNPDFFGIGWKISQHTSEHTFWTVHSHFAMTWHRSSSGREILFFFGSPPSWWCVSCQPPFSQLSDLSRLSRSFCLEKKRPAEAKAIVMGCQSGFECFLLFFSNMTCWKKKSGLWKFVITFTQIYSNWKSLMSCYRTPTFFNLWPLEIDELFNPWLLGIQGGVFGPQR